MHLIRPHLKGPRLQRTIQKITRGCQICAQNNPKTECSPTAKVVQYKGICPFADWQVDFTQIPKTIAFIDTFFSGWVETYPTRTEKATEVAKLLLKAIMSRVGLPHIIQTNSGSSFTSEISQKIGQALQIQWKLCASWRLQSMRETEKVNHSIEKTLAKYARKHTWKGTRHFLLLWIRAVL